MYTAAENPVSAIGATRTLIAPLERSRSVAADNPAVVCADHRLSHSELYERAQRLVGALRALRIERGDRIAVTAPNCHRYLELYLAVPAGGFILVPLNARHTDAELRYSLRDSGARVLFADTRYRGLADAVEHFVALPDGHDALLAEAEPGPWAPVGEHHLAGLFYTGGTTGAAKGVMLTHGNLVANAFHFMACWPFTPSTRWLVVAPMFHAAGTIGVIATVWAAGQHVILPAFDPRAALDTIEAERVTATLVVPTMLAALTDEQRRNPRDVSSLRYLSHGGSPVSTEVVRKACEAFPAASLLHVYGATETSPIVTLFPDEKSALDTPRARSCGQPAVGVELEVVDSAGNPMAPREIGEVRARGPNVTAGYWNKPEETAKAISDGWYLTGDLGYLDEQAYLYLVDRAKDMIVSGGENVYSTEVEEALHLHPAVVEAAVFGVPDQRWGEAVHAVVVAASDVTEDELIEHCRARIAGYKLPKRVELRAKPLPKSGAGKILKRELRRPYWEGRDTGIGGA